MADPLDASYIPKPEWNFLFFYEALKFLPGRLEIIATVGIPAVGTLILLLIPFVDRDPERHPLKRPLAMAGWVIVVAGFVALTLAGAYSKPEGVEAVVKTPAPPTAAAPAVVSTDEKAGMDLYKTNGCAACHRIGGTGGSIGPDLSGEGGKGRSREWLGDHLRNPKAHAPATVMPSFAALGDKAINQLVDYLLSLKGQESATASASAVAAAAGRRLRAPARAHRKRAGRLLSSAAPSMALLSSRGPVRPAMVRRGRGALRMQVQRMGRFRH
jgi:mono/diheme cytochrome c family protein